MRVFLLLPILFFSTTAPAQGWNALNPRELVIVHSTKDYGAALTTARDASKRLGLPLDLDGNRPHKTAGLTNSEKDCEDSGWDYPCYLPRGSGTPGRKPPHVSIEWSNAYEGFTPGYYIVVVADEEPGSETSRGVLVRARKHYGGAYAKKTKVWYGCMH